MRRIIGFDISPSPPKDNDHHHHHQLNPLSCIHQHRQVEEENASTAVMMSAVSHRQLKEYDNSSSTATTRTLPAASMPLSALKRALQASPASLIKLGNKMEPIREESCNHTLAARCKVQDDEEKDFKAAHLVRLESSRKMSHSAEIAGPCLFNFPLHITEYAPYDEMSAQVLDFLQACHRCRRQLQGCDIFIYQGDKAFCSLECRKFHMMRRTQQHLDSSSELFKLCQDKATMETIILYGKYSHAAKMVIAQ